MRDLMPLITLFAFMLIPLWIPLAAITVGAIADLVNPRETVPVRERGATLQAPVVQEAPSS